MLTLRGSTWTAGAILPVAVLVLIAGCASLSPAAGTPITDAGAIAGKWAGRITPGDDPFYLTITPAGTQTATWGRTTRGGR